MRKFLLLSLLTMMCLTGFAQVKRVAILEVIDKENKLSYDQKLMMRSNLTRAIANMEGFEAYDRSDVDAIFKEHSFQRTGNVSEKQIKKIGEMTGAAYILVVEGVLTHDEKLFATAKILNVETTHVERTDNVTMGLSTPAIQRGCRSLASKMFGSMAGASTATNKFVDFFKPKSKKDKNAEKKE